ncbi:hypothetical protein MP478_13700 [Chryseobacterium sp. WG14]|uniref:hypothetical protein n=1 Tax=unclassified Chryseobacterium TaxID=2593645 RepID=UPI0009D7B50E|nr:MULTISPECIES: hypothetical protein [unclassified Chryseobacterium]MCQ9636556.1 hypothetical protein [Chryseobacterium sp. WG23]MCQ9640436.1 hypothetical protein [Chryseobacterium sp. WG14]SMC79025.1 hypothetical protein SAMN02787074_3137 [Chryseobacterium sp. YR221]
MKTIKFFFSALFFLLLISCDGNKKFLEELQQLTKNKPQYDPVPRDVANRMQSEFKSKTYNELVKMNLLKSDEFILGKKEWEEINHFLQGNNKISVIRFYFIQFNQGKFGTKYTALQNYDGKLYILLGYFNGNNELIGDKYYGMMSLSSGAVEVSPEDFQVMHEDYKKNIKPYINQFCVTKNNTEYLKIDAIDFAKQQGGIEAHDRYISVKFKQLKFKLAEVVDPGNIEIVKNKAYYITKYRNDIGQLTTLTDAEDMAGKPIQGLNDYDMNSLCPQQCP